MNLIIYYSKEKDILKIVSQYKNTYNADTYEIETSNDVNFMTKFTNSNVPIKKCNINLKQYDNIILISPLWFNKVPSPVIRFLEQATGHINNIIYVLYNYNKNDQPKEFTKMDKILNMRRDKAYFVRINKKEINFRNYQ